MKRFGIALSGGGHRASLFGLGVMLYLADADKLSSVASISSVSGGSITNGFLAQVPDLQTLRGKEFQQACWPLAKALARTGTLWAWWGTWLYLLVTVMFFLAAIAWPWLLGREGTADWQPIAQIAFRAVVALLGVAVVWQLFVKRRGVVCRWALQATLLKDKQGRPTLLKDTARNGRDHVVCATEIHAGEHIYFSGRFVYSARLGCGSPDKLTVAHGVQASAAFPGGFMPTYIPTRPLRFQGGEESCTSLALLDGGLYDNMADQWQFGLKERKQRPNFADDLAQDCEELIVVNACNNMSWSSVTSLSIPLVGEVLSLLRTTNILFDNTTTMRRRYLVDKFSRQADFSGVMITLEQSPLRIPKAFAVPHDPGDSLQQAQAVRANEMLTALKQAAGGSNSNEFWQELVDQNKQFPTTMKALGVRPSAQLILQAYVTAMANLHVVLDYPQVRIPKLTDIEAYLLNGAPF